MRKLLACLLALSLVATLGAQSLAKQEKTVPVLKVLYNYANWDMNTDPTAAILEKYTAQKVEYVTLPADNADQKLFLELVGAVKYNAIKVNRAQFDQLAAKGALLDLKPYIDKNGKNFKTAISARTWGAVAGPKGEIFGVPEKNSSDNINNALIVRADVLAAEGLKVPTTSDEFVAVLKALQAKGYEQPFAETRTTMNNGVAGAFGVAQEWLPEGSSLAFYGASAAWKDYLDFMKSLYAEGLLGKDWPTKDADAVARFTKPLAEKPTVFMPFSWWSATGLYAAIEKNGVADAKKAVALIPSLKGPKGAQATAKDLGISYITVIPKYMAGTAVQTLAWIDKRLAADAFKETVIGSEGYHFTMKDGKYWPNMELNKDGKAKFDEKNNSSWFLMGTREDDYAAMWQARVRKTPANYHAWEAMFSAPYGVYNPLGFAPVIEAWTKARAPLTTKASEFAQKYVTGVDSDYAKFQADLKAAGLEVATKDVNAWYATQKK